MDRSKALQKLAESIDLVGMIEELSTHANSGRVTPSTMAGMRITLRSVKEQLLASYDVLSEAVLKGNAKNAPAAQTSAAENKSLSSKVEKQVVPEGTKIESVDLTEPQKLLMRRKDLRASIERIVDR